VVGVTDSLHFALSELPARAGDEAFLVEAQRDLRIGLLRGEFPNALHNSGGGPAKFTAPFRERNVHRREGVGLPADADVEGGVRPGERHIFDQKAGSGKVLTDEPVTPVGPWADIQRIALKTLAFAGLVPTATAVGVERISQM